MIIENYLWKKSNPEGVSYGFPSHDTPSGLNLSQPKSYNHLTPTGSLSDSHGLSINAL